MKNEETCIDDIADRWVADIKGDPVQLATNGNSREVLLQETAKSGDVKIYYMTEVGQNAFREGVPFNRMVEGVHYRLACTIPYRPTPPDLFNPSREEHPERARVGKTYKQVPLRIKH